MYSLGVRIVYILFACLYFICYLCLKLNAAAAADDDDNVVNLLMLDRLLVGSPRSGQPDSDGNTKGMLYKCRLHNRLPLNQLCTPFIGNSNLYQYRIIYHYGSIILFESGQHLMSVLLCGNP